MLLLLLFYFRFLNNPYNAILRKGYSFPDSNSESMPKSVVFISFKIFVFASFFPTLELFTYPTRRRGFDSPAPVKGSPGMGNTQGVKLKYFNT